MTATNEYKGQHYELIKSRIDFAFTDMPLHRSDALRNARLHREPWMIEAPENQQLQLASANKKAWSAQNRIDKLLGRLKDVYSFAEPLLKAMLREQYSIDVDVKNTYLRLYTPKDTPWYAIHIITGHTARTVSLLDAALHNFAYDETFEKDSAFINKTDPARDLFDISPIDKKISVSQFQALCRELDIGSQYKAHLETILLTKEPVAEAYLRTRVQDSQQAALGAAARMALIKKDLSRSAHTLIREMLDGRPDLKLDDQHMRACDLGLMDLNLTGILIIRPDPDTAQHSQRMIAYVPHDPEHPLKEYPSTLQFMKELSRQLRENHTLPSTGITYRQFFSQFVDHEQRGHFFAGLEQRLTYVKWYPKEPADPRPSWRETPVDNPRLQFSAPPITRPLWTWLYQQQLNKILNDARVIAVPTADADSNARWAWWENFKKIASDIFNAALLVLTPFVPGLGELMLAYTAYQLTTEVVEGVLDLIEGQWTELAEHVVGVVTDIIQLEAFGAGTAIGHEFRLKLSPLVEGMKPVTLPDGTPTLWHPDLKPYEQIDVKLPGASQPDTLGLHRHLGKPMLPLEGKLYTVETPARNDPGATHRIKHPNRTNAYSPKLEHNGQGAWVHEGENPQDWEGETLMRRLGHSVERFSPVEREQIRITSGTDDNELRRMHMEHAPPPPLLVDTVKRINALDEVQIASAHIRRGQALDPMSVWFEPLLTGLPGWPAGRAMKVYATSDLSGYSRTYGNVDATDANTLKISLPELLSGQFAERVSGFLAEPEITALLGRKVPLAERTQALRDRLADAVEQRPSEIARRIYQSAELSDKADVHVLKQTFPDMPLTLAQKVLAEATPGEHQRIVDEHRLPLRVKNLAREMDFEASATRAYDGFYHHELMVPDTERLALRTLQRFSTALDSVRVEVRDGTYDGHLRCSVGPEDATTVRQLIRDEYGRYEVLDEDNRPLHAADDFYEAILQAVPPDRRTQLDYQRGQGQLLKSWLMEIAAPPAGRRTLLAEPPVRPVARIETEKLLRWPSWFGGAKTPEKRIKALYPHFTEQQVTDFVRVLRTQGDPDQAIDRINDELKQLRRTLQRWRDDQPTRLDEHGEPVAGVQWDFLRTGGTHIEERLLECFERKSEAFGEHNVHPDGGYTLDLSTELSRPDLDRWWKQLRRLPDIQKYLDQITVLNMDNAHFSPNAHGLLNDLPNLRQLSARRSGLNGVPRTIGQLQQLRMLDLADNGISLAPDSLEQLRGLTRLETLTLDGNPLRRPPDVGDMPNLKVLRLARTGIEDWPQGLFRDEAGEKIRPRGFSLDLRQCPIRSLPQVTPGSDHAFVLARTRLSTQRLADIDRVRFGDYRESVGLARQQAYSGAVEDELVHWQPASARESVFSPSESHRSHNEESWHDVLAEPGAADFFRVIRRQRESQDFQSMPSRRQLTTRVWQMVDAMALDSDLREELFQQARQPETCADAGSQLFNNMGMKVLVSEAREQSTTAAELEDRLVRLARSAARLEKVGDIARAEISSQQQKYLIDPANHLPPDDVEVHLAYETGLAKRLELPWQAEGMLYETRSGVDQARIDRAYRTVIEREEGDGLVNGMIDLFEHPFWEQHLRRTRPAQFEANDRLFDEKLGVLEDLREAQKEWADNQDPAQTTPLARKLEGLAQTLNVPEDEVFSGEEMSPWVYNRLVSDIGYARNGLARTMTREALNKAGL